MSAHSLTSAVGIGSRSDDLVLDDLRILRMSSSDTGSKEVRALLLLFGIYIVKEVRCIHLTNLYSLCEQVARSSTPSTKQKLNQLKLFSKKEKLYPHISK